MSARTGLKESLPLLKPTTSPWKSTDSPFSSARIDLDRLADRGGRLLAHDAELGEARDAGADAQDGALVGDLVERGDRHRRQRRMAREGIGDAGAELHPRGMLGEDRQGRIDLAVETLVGHPERVVAVGLGKLGALDHLRDRHIAQHQQFERHVSNSSRGFIPGRRREGGEARRRPVLVVEFHADLAAGAHQQRDDARLLVGRDHGRRIGDADRDPLAAFAVLDADRNRLDAGQALVGRLRPALLAHQREHGRRSSTVCGALGDGGCNGAG